MRPSAWLDRFLASPRWDEVVIWALDLETTGLRPDRDRILSVGMVPIRQGVVRYGERFHSYVRPDPSAALSNEGIRAHHLLPADYAGAPPVAEVVPEIDRRLREGVLLVHYAQLDVAFLKNAFARTGISWPKPNVLDTVDLLLKLHHRRHRFSPHPPKPRTGLGDAREAAGLPAYPSHDALSDALATAELFLLLRSRLGLCTLRALR
jgi:DNA polymerase III subunit epsilon